MRSSIYDVLRGSFESDERPLYRIPKERRRVLSIVDNLDRLFNTRRRTIEHMMDYGLPDISEIYRDIPESIPDLQAAIQETVEKYEPRLTNVRVRHQEKEQDRFDMKLTFILSGRLVGREKIRFETTFQSEANPNEEVKNLAQVTRV
jgi:type VI secretion system protein